MEVPLPRGKRPVAMVFGGIAIGAVIAGAGLQMPALLDRPQCAETVMRAVSTEKTIDGSFACFDADLQEGLNTAGIDSDGAFAKRVGRSGTYHYLHKTEDGGYVYEYDRFVSRHNQLQGALNALKNRNVGLAWAEITGQTQNPSSKVYTLYVDRQGKISAVI